MNYIIRGSALSIPLPDCSVQCVVTSPPYWGLRKYAGNQELVWGRTEECAHEWSSNGTRKQSPQRDHAADGSFGETRGQEKARAGMAFEASLGNTCLSCGAWRGGFGLEPTVAMYVQHTVEILREIRRVLRPDGICFWNIGDSYARSGAGGGRNRKRNEHRQHAAFSDSGRPINSSLKRKDLCLIPQRIAIAAQDDGWWVRDITIWQKANPLPESVRDRCTKSYESILMLTKSKRYYWDAEAVKESAAWQRWGNQTTLSHDENQRVMPNKSKKELQKNTTRNLRNVWTFATQPYKGGHFAAFPVELPRRCIKAACPDKGCCRFCGTPWKRVMKVIKTGEVKTKKFVGWTPRCRCRGQHGLTKPSLVLDPFAGVATTGLAASELKQDCVLLDISAEYLQMASDRLSGKKPDYAEPLKALTTAVVTQMPMPIGADVQHYESGVALEVLAGVAEDNMGKASSAETVPSPQAGKNSSRIEAGNEPAGTVVGSGYGVTLPPNRSDSKRVPGNGGSDVIGQAEKYLRSYLSFPDDKYFLPLALFAALEHCWDACFDEVPYLSVGAAVKSAGKTRVLELLQFLAGEERAVLADGSITQAALYTEIDKGKTILIDESERFHDSRSPFRPILNSGYRRGQHVYRKIGGKIEKFSIFSPKVFSHIGDLYDTLRDRCIVVIMQRTMGGHRKAYDRSVAQEDGNAIGEQMHEAISAKMEEIKTGYHRYHELYPSRDFLRDRDTEIWKPLFSLCQVLAPLRIPELERSAIDIATLKTLPIRHIGALAEEEKKSEEMEYAERLLADVILIMEGCEKMATSELIQRLRARPTSPWRTYRGSGITDDASGAVLLASLLKHFGVGPRTIRVKPKGEPNSTVKGYTRADLIAGAERAGVVLGGEEGRNSVTPAPMAAEGERGPNHDATDTKTPGSQMEAARRNRILCSPPFGYPGGKSRLARKLVSFMPARGRVYLEPFAGRGNVFWAAASLLDFAAWSLNDNRTLPFLEAMRDIADTVKVPVCSAEEYQRQWEAFKEGDPTAILLEPYLTFSGSGYESGWRGENGPTAAGYTRKLCACHRLLHTTGAVLSGYDWMDCDWSYLTRNDFVFFDPSYFWADVRPCKDINHEDLVHLLRTAKFKWTLTDYAYDLYVRELDQPFDIQPTQSSAINFDVAASKERELVCMWKNY